MDPSPVTKITGIARETDPAPACGAEEAAGNDRARAASPRRPGGAHRRRGSIGIAEIERAKVLTASEFIGLMKDPRRERETFGNIPQDFVDRPLTDAFWKERLSRFFNAGPTTSFEPGKRATSGSRPKRRPPSAIPSTSIGSMRPPRRATRTISARFACGFHEMSRGPLPERRGGSRSPAASTWSTTGLRTAAPPSSKPCLRRRRTIRQGRPLLEVFDRRRRLQRLTVFAETEATLLAAPEKIELARQILAAAANLHRHDAAHLDLGGHSIWLEAPTTAKLSHLLAARYPQVRTIGNSRYQFLSSVDVPEDHLGVDNGHKCRDVFLAGVAVHQLLFGKVPNGSPPEWQPRYRCRGHVRGLARLVLGGAGARSVATLPRRGRGPEGVQQGGRRNVRPRPRSSAGWKDTGARSGPPDSCCRRIRTRRADCESDSVEIWRSEVGEARYLVKLWKQASWGRYHPRGRRHPGVPREGRPP